MLICRRSSSGVPSTTTRPLSVAAAEQLGLPAGLPVCLGGADSVLACLGLGVSQPGDVACVAGTSTVLLGVADNSEKVEAGAGGKVARGFAVGMALAGRAKERGITRVVFDRAGYAYHGRVKAVAEGARKGGLEF